MQHALAMAGVPFHPVMPMPVAMPIASPIPHSGPQPNPWSMVSLQGAAPAPPPEAPMPKKKRPRSVEDTMPPRDKMRNDTQNPWWCTCEEGDRRNPGRRRHATLAEKEKVCPRWEWLRGLRDDPVAGDILTCMQGSRLGERRMYVRGPQMKAWVPVPEV